MIIIAAFIAIIVVSVVYGDSEPDYIGWATGIEVTRGYADISSPMYNGEPNLVTYGADANALGPTADDHLDVVSLGDGGQAVLTFEEPIVNGDGNDFAVFENSFDGKFLELAFVEVSSDGNNFFRFDSVSLTPTNEQKGNISFLDTDNIRNLAGKYPLGKGTLFDLDELKNRSPLLDVNNVNYVKVIDVVGYIEPADFDSDGKVGFADFCMLVKAFGSVDSQEDFNLDIDLSPDGVIDIYDLQEFSQRWLNMNEYGTYDSTGRQINEPWPTPFHWGGFDLEAVGVINQKE